MHDFQFALGSVQGKDHRKIGKNNQDAASLYRESNLVIATVADGCGAEEVLHSEVGALLGVRLFEQICARHTKRSMHNLLIPTVDTPEFWEGVRLDLLAELRVLARQMGESLTEIVANYFLFTLVSIVITPEKTALVTLGDGTAFLNGEQVPIDKYEENKPPYVAYGLLSADQLRSQDPSGQQFNILRVLDTAMVSTFLIGTDGALQLTQVAEEYLTGTSTPVGPISQFWTDNSYFFNRYRLQQRLFRINESRESVDWQEQRRILHHGLLNDDTTILVGRRVPQED